MNHDVDGNMDDPPLESKFGIFGVGAILAACAATFVSYFIAESFPANLVAFLLLASGFVIVGQSDLKVVQAFPWLGTLLGKYAFMALFAVHAFICAQRIIVP